MGFFEAIQSLSPFSNSSVTIKGAASPLLGLGLSQCVLEIKK
jgi:hypothetical protein